MSPIRTVIIDDDPAVDRQAGLFCQEGIGADANSHHEQVAWQHAAIFQA